MRHLKKDYLYTIVFIIVILFWMLSGLFIKNSDSGDESDTISYNKDQSMIVEVENSHEQLIKRYITAQGHVLPNREVTLKSETNGKIQSIILRDGAFVDKGDLILDINLNDRQAKLNESESKILEMKEKYNSFMYLTQKGYAAKIKIAEARSALKSEQAKLKSTQLDIASTRIRAPFSGVIEQQYVEVGDYINVGSELLTIIDNSSLRVSVHIPQHDYALIHIGGAAIVTLATGQNIQGKVQYISSRADKTTRTFLVRIIIPNHTGLPSGTSAEVKILTDKINAHLISPGILSFDPNGRVGIKVISNRGLVKFYAINIVKSERKGLYVTGLPSSVKIITSGQGFVSSGEKIKYMLVDKNSRLIHAQEKHYVHN